MYESLLREDVADAPSFDQLVQMPDVQPVPMLSDTYALTSSARSRWLDTWWSDLRGQISASTVPAELRDAASRFVDYYTARGSEIDQLACLVFVDQQRTLELFGKLFDAADRNFDLARCHDLLDLLGESDRIRNRVLGQELKLNVDQCAAYLRVRTLWADDWYRTARFLEPAGLRKPFEQLIQGEPSRCLQLHAPGGLGKTMRLRWLTARWFVPAHIAVARIDFDTVDPALALSEPWLVLVELGRQLSDQLPHSPFTELLKDYAQSLPLLYRSKAGAQVAASAFLASRNRATTDVLQRFAVGLTEATHDAPVVIIFDTTEEVLLRPDIDAWRDMLRLVYERCGTVRFVFSGRYEAGEKSAHFADAFPDLVTQELRRFTRDESQRYLAELRGIEASELVDIAVRQADGLPFKLALFGDVLQERPEITAAMLAEYRDPDLLYLIERVIERIPFFSVRWLLRYGALPRVLDRRVLEEFLLAYIRRGIAGEAAFDEPHLDELPQTRTGAATVPFATGLHDESELDPRLLWDRVRQYASSASWVVSEREDTIRFHPDVVNPMRRILRRQPAFEILNREAQKYFVRLAEDEPQTWGPWMREAVHHAFELSGNAAVDDWSAAIATARERGRYDWCRLLASEVIEREDVGSGGERIAPADGSELLDLSTVSLAHFELGAAYVNEARQMQAQAAHPLWSQARSEVDIALKRGDARRIPAVRAVLMNAALVVRDAALSPWAAPTLLTDSLRQLRSTEAG
ncbi:MAG: hypothetical protein JO057_23380, partial [Chloroflexi bacterium]|nr:hypothetical protein [Chloroflexota bacterium]